LDRIVEIIKRAEYYLEEIPEPGKILETPQGAEIASWIDHTLLKPEATAEQVRYLCEEAQEFQFASVCVNPSFVPLVSGLLVNSGIDICAVVGFPLGATLATQKIFETLSCMDSGATEIDMVMNIGALKGQAYGMVLNEIQSIAQVVHNQRGVLKVILEMSFLTKKEKIMACLLSEAAGADFVKTSTGFGPGGAKLEDVDLMNRIVGKSLSIKAAGGIRDCETAKAMIVSGASRIGTSSGVKIVQEATA
jgi:deoxyribose-phosphate aldolase